jgi:hypothetical protein
MTHYFPPVAGSATTTGTTAVTIIPAYPDTNRRLVITSLQCGRTDAGTTAITLTFNDLNNSVIVLPPGAGASQNMNFHPDAGLRLPLNTGLTMTSSAAINAVFCNAQGYVGN